MDTPTLYYCKACERTYDGHAQCCFEMDHVEVKIPIDTTQVYLEDNRVKYKKR